jgi:hypothetical protein
MELAVFSAHAGPAAEVDVEEGFVWQTLVPVSS